MIASALFHLAYRRFREACAHPLAVQATQLRRILRLATGSDVGRRHGFARMARISDPGAMIAAFQQEVPVRSCREMRGELEAVYAGRWRTLCPSPPRWFSMTAGSTGQFKYVPVTEEYRREIARSSMIFSGALEACYPDTRRLKTQFLVGSAEGGRSPVGVPQGFASGFNYKHLPAVVRSRFVLPYWIFTIGDAEERSYAAGRILMNDPRLGVLCAISPVNLLNLRQALDRNAERLVSDVAAGTLTVHDEAAVPGQWRTAPQPALARKLDAFRLAGTGLPSRELFPALRVLVCWQGGNMSYYLPELRAAFGVDATFELPISASEGVFAIPLRANQPGGALAVTTHFLEFLPDDGGSGCSGALRADQLEKGREYRVVVTNAGGLYRYDMEDIVRVTSFFRATPVIEFVCKKDRQVSVSNERLTELDVTLAMQEATRRRGSWFPEFLFVPCSDRRYRVVLDGSSCERADCGALDAEFGALAWELEQQLRAAAKGYDFEREDALLDPLQLMVTAPGELRDYLARRSRGSGLPNAQVKPLHLASEFNLHTAFRAVATYAA